MASKSNLEQLENFVVQMNDKPAISHAPILQLGPISLAAYQFFYRADNVELLERFAVACLQALKCIENKDAMPSMLPHEVSEGKSRNDLTPNEIGEEVYDRMESARLRIAELSGRPSPVLSGRSSAVLSGR